MTDVQTAPTPETQAEQNRKTGRLVSGLGLEEKILSDGVLPTRKVEERSAIVMGIVDSLLEQRKLRKVLSLVDENPTARALYSGDVNQLYTKVATELKPSDFKVTENERVLEVHGLDIAEILIAHDQTEIMYQLALNPEIDYRAAVAILDTAKEKIGEDNWREGIKTVALRIENAKPRETYELLQRFEDRKALDAFYERLESNFALKNVELMLEIVMDYYLSSARLPSDRIAKLIKKALKDPKIEKYGDLGEILYNTVIQKRVKLSKKETEVLEDVVVKNLRPWEVFSGAYTPLQLRWAKARWKEDPVQAYRTFVDKKYKGKEVVPAAKAAFIKSNTRSYSGGERETVKIRPEHLRAFYDELSPKDIELREIAARELGDKERLHALSYAWIAIGDFESAYQTRFESGVHDSAFEKIRRKLINKEIAECRKRGWGLFFNWLDERDQKGYELAFDSILAVNSDRAYELASKKMDDTRMIIARVQILERNAPEVSLKFFGDKKDPIGYSAAMDKLAVKYELPKAEVEKIIASGNKK